MKFFDKTELKEQPNLAFQLVSSKGAIDAVF